MVASPNPRYCENCQNQEEDAECLPTEGCLHGEDGGSSLIENGIMVTCQPCMMASPNSRYCENCQNQEEDGECLKTEGCLHGEDAGSSLIDDSVIVTCQPQYPAEIYQLA